MTAILEITDVSKTFQSENGESIQALAPVSLGIEQGEFLSIIGPSGCGKSTLFNVIGGMTPADSGVVAAMLSLSAVAQEMDEVSVAIGQRGLWDTLVVHQGIEEGIFAEENLSVDMTWTKGGAETLQAVTTRSVDMGFVNGMLGVLGAYQRGAAVRIVGAEMTGSNDLFWYVKGDSDLESLADAEGATVGYDKDLPAVVGRPHHPGHAAWAGGNRHRDTAGRDQVIKCWSWFPGH